MAADAVGIWPGWAGGGGGGGEGGVDVVAADAAVWGAFKADVVVDVEDVLASAAMIARVGQGEIEWRRVGVWPGDRGIAFGAGVFVGHDYEVRGLEVGEAKARVLEKGLQ